MGTPDEVPVPKNVTFILNYFKKNFLLQEKDDLENSIGFKFGFACEYDT
jgi:hypothetical protein